MITTSLFFDLTGSGWVVLVSCLWKLSTKSWTHRLLCKDCQRWFFWERRFWRCGVCKVLLEQVFLVICGGICLNLCHRFVLSVLRPSWPGESPVPASPEPSILRKRTLTLGETPSSDDGIDWRDSQVSSGWHGKAITYWNKVEKEEAAIAEQEQRAKALASAFQLCLITRDIVSKVWLFSIKKTNVFGFKIRGWIIFLFKFHPYNWGDCGGAPRDRPGPCRVFAFWKRSLRVLLRRNLAQAWGEHLLQVDGSQVLYGMAWFAESSRGKPGQSTYTVQIGLSKLKDSRARGFCKGMEQMK